MFAVGKFDERWAGGAGEQDCVCPDSAAACKLGCLLDRRFPDLAHSFGEFGAECRLSGDAVHRHRKQNIDRMSKGGVGSLQLQSAEKVDYRTIDALIIDAY
jgi:hypothetical protein